MGDLTGVAFQQSILRHCKFVNAKVENAGFFDADLEEADFTGASMNQANFELARLTNANFTNAIATELFVTGSTTFKGDKTIIDGADFTETTFRVDQRRFLCSIAKGTNPV